MTTIRWTFTEVETDETYTLPLNPDAMTSPYTDRVFEYSYGTRYQGSQLLHTVRRPDRPKDWEFSGVIRDQAHHDALVTWVRKPGLIHVEDHLGRVFEVMLTAFEPTDRKPTAHVPWRLRYTMKALLLRRVS